VTVRSLRIASDETDEAIIQYARRAYNLLIGERTAESIKIAVGSACPQREEQMTAVRGRDLVSGLPRAVPMAGTEIRAAIAEPIAGIVAAVKMALERTPPELAADIVDRGIMMAGAGSLLRGLDRLLAEETGMPVTLTDDPLGSVVVGPEGSSACRSQNQKDRLRTLIVILSLYGRLRRPPRRNPTHPIHARPEQLGGLHREHEFRGWAGGKPSARRIAAWRSRSAFQDCRLLSSFGDGDGGPVLLECPVGAGRRNSSACLHQESNCRALLAFDLYFGECGNGDQVHAVRSNISPGDRDRLDGLVHRTCPDGLELDRTLLTQHCGESAGNGFRLRVGSDFQHVPHTKCAPSTAATIAADIFAATSLILESDHRARFG